MEFTSATIPMLPRSQERGGRRKGRHVLTECCQCCAAATAAAAAAAASRQASCTSGIRCVWPCGWRLSRRAGAHQDMWARVAEVCTKEISDTGLRVCLRV